MSKRVIGKVGKHSEDAGASCLVVDTGVRIFGKHVLLPAGTIERIDTAGETVYVNRTKDQIKDAPEFDEAQHTGEPSYLEQSGRYYGQPHMQRASHRSAREPGRSRRLGSRAA